MPNPTQSPAETKLYTPRAGDNVRAKVYRADNDWRVGTFLRIDDDGDAWLRQNNGHDICVDASTVELRVSPAAAVSDLCDACGKPAVGAPLFDWTMANRAGHARVCAWHEGQTVEEIDAAITRRRSLAEPGFKVGDIVNGLGAGAACQKDGRRYEGPVTGIAAAGVYGFPCVTVKDAHYGERVVKLDTCRLIRPSPTEAARTGEGIKACPECRDDHRVLDCKACGKGDPSPRPTRDPYRATMIAQCQHMNADLLRGFCPDCGSSSKELVETRPSTEKRMVNYLRWHDAQGKPSKLEQAKAQLNAASRKPRYAETSRVFSTATWEEDS